MSLLVVLALIYVGVLVLALAASLIAIWVYLLLIGNELKKVRTALGSVEQSTRPLETPLQLLQSVSGEVVQSLDQTQTRLAGAGKRLGVSESSR